MTRSDKFPLLEEGAHDIMTELPTPVLCEFSFMQGQGIGLHSDAPLKGKYRDKLLTSVCIGASDICRKKSQWTVR